jgi:hypothetical protein
MIARTALASVVFALLVGCSAAPDTEDTSPVVTKEATGEVKQEMRRADGCICTLEPGANVWRCNGQCSDEDMGNLPH